MVTYLSGNRIQGSSAAGAMNTCTGFNNEYDASVGDGNIRATKITAAVSGSVTSLSCDLQNATGNVALGLYADNSGVPDVRLGYTASTAVVAGVNTVALIAPVSITASTVYWISVETSNGNNIKLTFSQASGTTYYKGSTYGTPPSPFGSASAHTTGLQVCLVAAGTDEKTTLEDIVRVTNTATVTITSDTGENEGFGNSSGGVIRVKQVFATGHELIGDTVTKFTVNLNKAGSPTGTMTAKLYTSGDVEKADFGSIDVSTFTTSFVTKTFNYVSGDSSIANGDNIQLRYSAGSSGNTINWEMCASCTISNTHEEYYVSSWTARTISATMTVTYGTASVVNVPAGTRYEETNTREIYTRTGSPNVVEWVAKGTAPTADILRGVWAGGGTYEDVIDYVTIASVGNATDFGNLSVARQGAAGCSGTGRGCFGGGTTGSATNTIDYITIASTGNAADFGDLTAVREANPKAVSSDTRGCWGGGNSGSYTNIIDYITIASTGNATDFGDLFMARGHMCSASSPVGATRGLYAGGSGTGSSVNNIEYITIASTGNATDFGDLLVAKSSKGGLADATRGCFAGGGSYVTDIEYVTIASTGNAVDFGDLSVGRQNLDGSAGHTRGCFAGGSGNSGGDVIDYITIATLGNATDFGNLSVSRSYLAGQVSA